MSRRLASRDVLWLALIAGAFLLLAVNVLFGSRGFDRPRPGLGWRLLEAPGLVLGWGGVALLVLAIPYALLTWMRGQGPGRVVSVLGALVVAFGIGGLAGCLAHPAAAGGGRVAGAVADLLRDALGPMVAGILFALICLPGLVLALAPLLIQASAAPSPARAREADANEARGWYPQRRLGPDGLEIPMSFPGTDVGEIRLREPEPEPEPEPESESEPPAGPPPIASLPASSSRRSRPIPGIRFADESEEGGPTERAREPLASPDEDRLPEGVRFAAPRESAPAPVPDAPPEAGPDPSLPESPEPPVAPVPPSPAPGPSDEPGPAPSLVEEAASRVAEVGEPLAPAAPGGSAEPPSEGASRPHPAPPAPREAEDEVAHALRPRRRAARTESGPESPPPEAARPAKAPRPKAKAPRSADPRNPMPGLFSSLPVEELPPVAPSIDEPEAPAPGAEPRVDPPGQTTLFQEGGERASKGRRVSAKDPLFAAGVEAAVERGSASLVLLQRKLGVGYARAAALMDALVAEGVLGEMTASGSRPTLITAAEWERRRRG